MASSGEKLLSLALPALGVLDVLVTTVAYARQGELLSERNPMIANITESHNMIMYYAWSVFYILLLTFIAKWLVSEAYKAKAGMETSFGKLLKRGVHDPTSIGQYDPLLRRALLVPRWPVRDDHSHEFLRAAGGPGDIP